MQALKSGLNVENKQKTQRTLSSRKTSKLVACAVVAVTAGLAVSEPTFGAARTWSGDNASGNWSLGGVGGNWTGSAAPATSDTLTFDGSNHLTDNSNNLTADLSIGTITFASTAGSFTLAGNRITFGGNITNSSANTQTINLDMILSGNRSISATSGDITVGGVISQDATPRSLQITGASHVVTLTGSNSYTGPTTIATSATLSTNLLANVGSNSGIGKGDGTSAATNAASLVINNSTFKYTGAAVSTDRLFTLGTTGGTIDSSGAGAITFSSSGAILSSTTAARTLFLTGSTGGTFNPTWDNAQATGANNLSKSGAGTWVLAGNNGYTGNTTVSAGTLTLTGTQTSGSYTVSGGTLKISASERMANTAVLSATGGTFDLQGFTETIGQINLLTGGSIIGTSGNLLKLVNASNTTTATGTNSITANLQLTDAASAGAATRTFDVTGSADTLSISGALSEASGKVASLTKTGAGLLTLSEANTYTGGTTLTGGTLTMANAAALGAAGSTVSLGNGSTLRYAIDGTVNAYTASIPVVAGGNSTVILDRATVGAAINQSLSLPAFPGASTAGGQTLTVNVGSNVNSGTPILTLGDMTVGANGGNTVHFAGTAKLSIGNISAVTPTATRATSLFLDSSSTGNQVTGSITNATGGGFTNAIAVSINNGDWTFNANNTYSGATTITTGTLTLGGTNVSTTYTLSSGTLALSGNDRLADAASLGLNNSTLNMNGSTDTIGLVTALNNSTITGTAGNKLNINGASGTTTVTGASTIAANLEYTTGVSRTFNVVNASRFVTYRNAGGMKGPPPPPSMLWSSEYAAPMSGRTDRIRRHEKHAQRFGLRSEGIETIAKVAAQRSQEGFGIRDLRQ